MRALRGEVEALGSELGAHKSTLAKLEFAQQALERTWLFLGQGDGSLVEGDHPADDDDVAMRIIETQEAERARIAQEAERARIAQEIHDGPAQALANAIFQADFIERIGASDSAAGADEVRTLRRCFGANWRTSAIRSTSSVRRCSMSSAWRARSRMPSSACGR